MFAPAMRGLTWGGPAGTGGRHDRRALTNFSVQVLHLIVGDDKVSVGMRVFAAVRMFLARHANREAERLYDHRGAGGPGEADDSENRNRGEEAGDPPFGHIDNSRRLTPPSEAHIMPGFEFRERGRRYGSGLCP